MSGTFTPLPVMNGQVPSIQAAIILCPNGANYYVKELFLFNNNPATQTVLVYFSPSIGSQTSWRRVELAQNEFADLLEGAESVTLTPGDSIQAITDTAGAVDYSITGVQET